jgi:hypothetical protein
MLSSPLQLGALGLSLAASFSLLNGCAPSLQARSAGLIGCKAADVEVSDERSEWGSREWTASCHGRRYTCSTFAAGEDAVQTACAPMSQGYAAAPGSPAAAHSAPAPSSGGSGMQLTDITGTAERSFDERRQLHIVNASFNFGAGIELKLIGVPQAALGPIGVTLAGKSWKPSVNECTTLEVVVNEQPYVPSELKASRRGDGGFILDGRVDFQAFKGLGQTYATFALRVCKEQFAISNRQLPTLKKFLVMYSEIATQVQKGELPAKSSESVTEPPTQPAAAPSPDPFAM